jgi:Arc/MetJ-type ribon-helix-helix transcriptional regulator
MVLLWKEDFPMASMISPQNEQLLNEAVSSGRFKDQQQALAEALRLLREQTCNNDPEQSLSADEWIASFRKWSRKSRQGNPNMDDSRESIYGDRGA